MPGLPDKAEVHLSLKTIHLSFKTNKLSFKTNELSLKTNEHGYLSLKTNELSLKTNSAFLQERLSINQGSRNDYITEKPYLHHQLGVPREPILAPISGY